MPLKDLLSPERVVVLSRSADRTCVLEVAADLLSAGNPLDAAAIMDSLGTRERLASTAIGHGVAIPHGRIAGIEQTRGVFLRLDEPVEFGAADGEPVDLVFAMAVPEHYVQEHLQQLAELAELFADPDFRRRLRGAADMHQLSVALLAGVSHRDAA